MKIAFTPFLIAIMLSLVSCDRVTEWRLVGTWRGEDDESVEEIALNSDRSYRELNGSKTELTIPSPIEQTGKWQVQDGQLYLDGTVTWAKQPIHTTLRLVKVRLNELIIRGSEATRDAAFMRLYLPTCHQSLSMAKTQITEKDLIGVWRVHYNTHDYEYSLNQNGSFSVGGTSQGATSI